MFDSEVKQVEAIAQRHADAVLTPEHAAPVARRILQRCATLKIPAPSVILRFQDRAEHLRGISAHHNKIARDFYGSDYASLSQDKQQQVTSLHSSLVSENPATGHPYLKPGFTFAQARHLLLETYRAERSNSYPQEIRTALVDFRAGLEKDLDEAAKRQGFFPEYSQANRNLRLATAGPHRATQPIPIVRK
jgi:hypothetical protein